MCVPVLVSGQRVDVQQNMPPEQPRGAPAPTNPALVCAVVAVDSAGNVFVGDPGRGRVRKITPSGAVSVVAGMGTPGFSGDGGLATSAQLAGISGLAVDATGNLFVAVPGRIRKVNSSGVISTIAGTGISGSSGDGGPAVSAQLTGPTQITADASGNLFVVDRNAIRKVAANGIISTVAGTGIAGFSGDGGPAANAQLNGPSDVALDSSGALFIADSGNNRIRKVAADGTIATIAGGSSSMQLSPATAITLGKDGGLIVTQFARVLRISPGGETSVLAGTGRSGYLGDGGPATAAQISTPNDIAVAPSGEMFIADYNPNRRIRRIASDGTISTFALN